MRVIANLNVKPPYVVKPVHFEGLRKIGDPVALVSEYYDQGADEIFFIDIVASLYQRNIQFDLIERAAEKALVPFAVGGGIRSLEDMAKLFHIGADKIVLNTYALQVNPSIIDEAAKIFGSQSIVINVEAKQKGTMWECYSDCGREKSNKEVISWIKECENRGAGEILLQSVDKDGRQRGFDVPLIKKAIESVSIPVVVASGAGNLSHIEELKQVGPIDAIAISSALHYGHMDIQDIKQVI